VVVMTLATRYRTGHAGKVSYGIAITVLLALLGRAYSHGSTWFLFFVLFLLSAVMAAQMSRARQFALGSALVLVLLFCNIAPIFEVLGTVSGQIQTRPSDNLSSIRALQSTSEHPVLVDPDVARYIFDYRLPAGYIDYGFSVRYPGFCPIDDKLRPEDIFVLGPGKVSLLNNAIHSHFPVESWPAFGMSKWSYYKFPRQAFIIPARDCIQIMEKNQGAKIQTSLTGPGLSR
jgi:hypothetical protein